MALSEHPTPRRQQARTAKLEKYSEQRTPKGSAKGAYGRSAAAGDSAQLTIAENNLDQMTVGSGRGDVRPPNHGTH